MIRLLVTGGRDFTDAALVERVLSAVHRKHGIAVLIEGGQISYDRKTGDRWGADWLCRQWAECNGIEVETYEADWNDIEAPGAVVLFTRSGAPYNAAAGPARNARMLAEGQPDFAVGFPGGSGTADMCRRCIEAGVQVWRVS